MDLMNHFKMYHTVTFGKHRNNNRDTCVSNLPLFYELYDNGHKNYDHLGLLPLPFSPVMLPLDSGFY